MKLLHHSQGYSQYTFIHRDSPPALPSPMTSQCSGPAQPPWSMDNWNPKCINPQQDGGLQDRETQVVGWGFGSVVLWMFVQHKGNHRFNLIHTRCLSASCLLNYRSQCHRAAVPHHTSRGCCVTVGGLKAQKTGSIFCTRYQTLASSNSSCFQRESWRTIMYQHWISQ